MTDTSSRWLVHFADRESIEVTFAPAADLAWVLQDYGDAVAAEPITEPAQDCRRCEHFAQPGLSDPGYCGAGLPGLVLACGVLHVLPADHGANCGEFIEARL